MRWQLAATVGLLVSFWLAMALIPPPGGTAGDFSKEGNLAIWIDRALLGSFRAENHYTWILSSLDLSATVRLGVFAGYLLRSRLTAQQKLLALIAGGVALTVTGWLWSLVLSCIKHLWISSMVLWAAGWSILLLASFYAVIDALGWRRWCFPFVVIGANAIVAHMLRPKFDMRHLGTHLFGGFSQLFCRGDDFVLALLTCTALWLLPCLLYRKNIFLRV